MREIEGPLGNVQATRKSTTREPASNLRIQPPKGKKKKKKEKKGITRPKEEKKKWIFFFTFDVHFVRGIVIDG
jgi:hypothetical protein